MSSSIWRRNPNQAFINPKILNKHFHVLSVVVVFICDFLIKYCEFIQRDSSTGTSQLSWITLEDFPVTAPFCCTRYWPPLPRFPLTILLTLLAHRAFKEHCSCFCCNANVAFCAAGDPAENHSHSHPREGQWAPLEGRSWAGCGWVPLPLASLSQRQTRKRNTKALTLWSKGTLPCDCYHCEHPDETSCFQ